MKTTVEISDSLLREARKLAAREGVSLRALLDRGLRLVLANATREAPFKLRRLTFKGKGLQAEFRGDRRREILHAAYENRGA